MNRLTWVDWSKTFLIFLMAVGHYACPDILRQFIYTFHMPAFFIISGYLYRPKSFVKVFMSFLVPLTFFGFVATGFIYLVNVKNGIVPFMPINHLWEIPTMFPGFWFVQTLFLCRCFSGDIKDKYSRQRIGWGGYFAS